MLTLLTLVLSLTASAATPLLECGNQQGNRNNGSLFTVTVTRGDDGALTLTTVACTLWHGSCLGDDTETDQYYPVTPTANGGYAGTGVSLQPLMEGGYRLSEDQGATTDFPSGSCR